MEKDKMEQLIIENEGEIAKINREVIERDLLPEDEIKKEFNPKINELQSKINSGLKRKEILKEQISQIRLTRKQSKQRFKKLRRDNSILLRRMSVAVKNKFKEKTKKKLLKLKKIRMELRSIKKELKVLDTKKFAEKWRLWGAISSKKTISRN